MHIAFAYFNCGGGTIKFYENELSNSIQKFYDLYHAFFSLLVEVKHFAEQKAEIRKTKLLATSEERNPNLRFIQNRVIADLESMEELQKYLTTKKMGWQNSPEIIKLVYNTLVSSDVYQDYMNNPVDSYSNDKQIIYYIFEQILPDNSEVYQLLEELSIYWNDDIELVLTMNIRTIQRMKESKNSGNKLLPLYKTDDDLVYVKTLFRQTIAKHERNHLLISELSSNWEAERIALADKVILELAITELTEFPLIPAAVTMNEYIDMAKFYSTEKSHIFVNGILEKVIDKLTKEGLIRKIGKGLLNEAKEE
jgi:N utilization substance protein B